MEIEQEVVPLINSVSGIVDRIVTLLSKLPFLDGKARDDVIKQVKALLKRVDIDVKEWANRELEKLARDHDEDLSALLPAFLVASPHIMSIVEKVSSDLQAVTQRTIRGVEAYAGSLSSPASKSRTIGKLVGKGTAANLEALSRPQRILMESQLKASLDRNFVRVLGRNGRIYRYAMDYWTAMNAQMSRGLLRRQISIFRTLEAGYDLVQITNNPSMHGDFCDLYRGKVFSISGTHPFYAPLSDVPNGGTPFHPWCKHDMLPFTSNVEDAELADIPPEFLELAQDPTTTINDFQKLWIEV